MPRVINFLFVLVFVAACSKKDELARVSAGPSAQPKQFSSVGEAIKLADDGFRGAVEITGIYDFHPEEDTLRDDDNSGLLQLELLPLLKDIPKDERYAARERLGKRYHGKRVVVQGELKKGSVEWYFREIEYVTVSEIKEWANKPALP
jgi:hypothetical protein